MLLQHSIKTFHSRRNINYIKGRDYLKRLLGIGVTPLSIMLIDILVVENGVT